MNRRLAKTIALYVSVGLATCVSVLAVMTWIGLAPGFRSRVYWMFGSVAYKHAVLAETNDSGLRHVEWVGDGWGGVPIGDWTGYVVYDPSDSLPQKHPDGLAIRVNGIPCDVVSVRRLEKNWYSVVTDMNLFWDQEHSVC